MSLPGDRATSELRRCHDDAARILGPEAMGEATRNGLRAWALHGLA
jgi:hypothetical protein